MPYHPSLNGVELLWALSKFKYRKALALKKTEVKKIDLNELIRESIDSIPSNVIKKMAKKGWTNIYTNEKA